MYQAVDRNAQCSNRIGRRIDEEGHVIVDDGDTRVPLALGYRLDRDGRFAALALLSGIDNEFSRLLHAWTVEWRISRE